MSNKKKKRINILFISHDVNKAGSEKSLVELVIGIDKIKFKPIVVLPHYGWLTDRLIKEEVDFEVRQIDHWIPYHYRHGIRHLKCFVIGFISRIRNIIEIINKHKIDLVYTNTVTCIDGAAASIFTKRPHIWHLREAISGNNDLMPYLPVNISNFIISVLSRRIIVNSKFLYTLLEGRISKKKINIVYNGVDLNIFKTNNSSFLHSELNISLEKKIVAIIGTLLPRKGYETFIESVKIVKNSFSDVAFLVVGKGNRNYENYLIKKVETLGLQNDVFFMGRRDDVDGIMNEIDILVLASIQEPFGRVLIEAMAAGKPVVSTRSGGPEEIVIDNETGFLVPVFDPHKMADAIKKLIENPILAQSLGIKGKIRAEQYFSLTNYVNKIEKIIDNAISRR